MNSTSGKFKGKRVLVVGLGISGRAAAHFLLRRGAAVTAADRNQQLLASNPEVAALCSMGLKVVPETISNDMAQFDLVVVSPGIPPGHPCYSKAVELGIEVIGEVELACREIKQKCLAVTGTNGKTTVTLLTEHVLQVLGKKAVALGNVGVPLTAALDEPEQADAEIFVIELSSFQLETLKAKFIDAGVLLNITPDHLDRYSSMQAYAEAKIRISENLKHDGKLFVEAKCWSDFKSLFGNRAVYTYGYNSTDWIYTDTKAVFEGSTKLFDVPAEYRGKRSHDLENLIAAFALCREAGITAGQFLFALSSFKKPAHRIEFVRTVAGVNYYDDSKGTNIDAVIRAVDGLEGKIVLIAGGVDKGFPYTSWINAFSGKVKSICAIGESKEKIKADLGQHIPVALFSTLQDAVVHAAKSAKPGETVLLSPGCSSYDMFKDYAHRGCEFQRIINAL